MFPLLVLSLILTGMEDKREMMEKDPKDFE
jgi:hypothetical protein